MTHRFGTVNWRARFRGFEGSTPVHFELLGLAASSLRVRHSSLVRRSGEHEPQAGCADWAWLRREDLTWASLLGRRSKEQRWPSEIDTLLNGHSFCDRLHDRALLGANRSDA